MTDKATSKPAYVPPETGVTATVQLTLEIKVNSSWGGDCSMDQVFKQARDEAVGAINNALGEARQSLQNRIKIVGTPSILAVAAERRS